MRIAELNSPVAENVSIIIKTRGLKQAYIAEQAGYAPQEMSDMLNGRRLIKPFDIGKIAFALQVDANTLFLKKERGD